MPGAYTPPQDDPAQLKLYSRYEKFRESLEHLADVLNDSDVEPQATDQFTNMEERLWDALAEVASLVQLGSVAGFFVADTLALMREIPSSSTNKICHLIGNVSAYDGYGGDYRWESDPTGVAVDGPMTDIIPDDWGVALPAHRGYWKKYR